MFVHSLNVNTRVKREDAFGHESTGTIVSQIDNAEVYGVVWDKADIDIRFHTREILTLIPRPKPAPMRVLEEWRKIDGKKMPFVIGAAVAVLRGQDSDYAEELRIEYGAILDTMAAFPLILMENGETLNVATNAIKTIVSD